VPDNATSATDDLLVAALRAPEDLTACTPAQWDRLIRQARRADLLGRLSTRLADRNLVHSVPDGPRLHVESMLVLHAAQIDEVRREVAQVQHALRHLDVDIVLLKGSAYVFAGLDAARGRLFSDIDLMVPKDRLAQVEAALMLAGWATTHHSAYDQRYYREWSHELPPLRHVARQTVLDVHHAILPPTARLKPSSEALLGAARRLSSDSRLAVLAPPDMVLHAMTHLFHNDDLSHAMRDISDVDLLLRQLSQEASFWPLLQQRAAELGLQRPLYYGLQHARRIFQTPIPDEVVVASQAHAPAWPLRGAMNALWSVALGKAHRSASGAVKATCLFLLYLRAHWLRMPPLMLVRHLTVKALRRNEKAAAA
jgi:hypothetical protein